MSKRKQLGTTNCFLPPVTFGAWAIENFGFGSAKKDDTIRALQTAFELGFTAIDTGPIYGLGFSEQVVGEAIAQMPRDQLQISTKCGTGWRPSGKIFDNPDNFEYDEIFEVNEFFGDYSKESILRQCEDSLMRLRTEYIDLYSIHWPNTFVPIEETMEAFEVLLRQGKIRAAGVCNHDLENLAAYEKIIKLSSDKIRYSMLNRGIEQDVVPYAQKQEISILAYSVLQRGVLTGIEKRPYIWSPNVENPKELALYKPVNVKLIEEFLNQIGTVANDYHLNLSQLCLNWTINRDFITTSLVGAITEQNVREMTAACNVVVSPNDWGFVNDKLSELELVLDLSQTPYEYNYKKGVITFY
jgi:aryl-alcohol dehydrogenase-like predicted oxidoreductase